MPALKTTKKTDDWTDFEEPVKKRSWGKFIFAVLFLAALVGLGWSSYSYYEARQEIKTILNGGQSDTAKQEVADLISKVGKLIVLPTGEDPVIATVKDVDSLIKTSDFYKGAKNGDKVLIYQTAKKAIIYREDGNILVNVGPVYFQDQNGAVTNTNSAPANANTNSAPATPKK